jgi:hypothetical protein
MLARAAAVRRGRRRKQAEQMIGALAVRAPRWRGGYGEFEAVVAGSPAVALR